MIPADPRWWHRATGYQVYPRSFQDSDGDGVGDIPGILSRLDHLVDLGIGFIWLSPVYASPMRDNGYDIADYRAIAPEFGTMSDFDNLLAAAKAKGIGIVMDLVVNHSSSDHAWFQSAQQGRDATYHDYYIWRDAGPDGGPPDGRRASFGGPAWSWVEAVGRYYLHLFSPGQPDLNWSNPALRAAIYDMMRWWLDKGIAGFRMDVIDLIGKDVDAGIYDEGPHLHPYLREMYDAALQDRDIVTIGESWAVSLATALLYCGTGRDELSMVFQFNHITAGWQDGTGKFQTAPADLVALKQTLFDWQLLMNEDGWNSLFLSNHDLPRQVSKYGDNGRHRVASAKALATVMHLMRGTPFVYQGEEIGMTNVPWDDIDAYRDLETLNAHAEQIADGRDPVDFLAGARVNGRDNARTPMQWDGTAQAGFTAGTPWIGVNPNADTINVAADRAEPEGIIAHYRTLIAARRNIDAVAFGQFAPFAADHPTVMAYTRTLGAVRLAVVANLGNQPVAFDVPAGLAIRGRCLQGNAAPRDELAGTVTLAPWEAVAIIAGD